MNALTHYEKALEYQPENATAAHMVAALKGQTSPEGAPLATPKPYRSICL